MLRMPVRRSLGAMLFFMAWALGVMPFPAAAENSFDEFANAFAADWIRANPQAATAQQYFTGAEQDELDRDLPALGPSGIPLSTQDQRAYRARAQHGLEHLKGFKRADLTDAQRVSAATMVWQLESAIRLVDAESQRLIFEQFRGLHVTLVNFMTQVQPLRTPRDVDNYLARLQQIGGVLDQGIAVAKARAASGTIPPKFILQSTVEGIDRFLSAPVEENPLVMALSNRTQGMAGFSADARAAALASAERMVADSVRPAFIRVREMLADQMNEAKDDAGLWRLVNGAKAYATALHVNTTTELTATEIHAIGLREVARIEREMDRQLRALGFSQGTVKERYAALEKSVQPAAQPDPRPGLIEEHARILKEAEERSKALFDLQPKAPVRVLREPSFTEKNAAAHYAAPAPDGTRPGTVWIPLPGPEFEILEMRTTTYHEGVPGHHFQIALQQESTEIPVYRRKVVFGGLSAFTEGWALYAEHLAVEADWYRGDPKGRLGQLSDELFRARRLVVDTGLHAGHWTRQQAIDYGISPAEVERYVVMPGQACAYKIGEMQILVQRAKAQKALGSRFSMKKFHNLLLSTGAVPLAVLGQVVDADIERAKREGGEP
jgi:uncharacterized protein (DUF885 family)